MGRNDRSKSPVGGRRALLCGSLIILCGTTVAPAQETAAARVEAGEGGYTLKSGDGDFSLRLRGLIQADGRFYDGPGSETDGFLLRRSRLEFSGTFGGRFDFRIMPDFGGSSTQMQDAWVRFTVSPALQVRAGKLQPSVSLERDQSRDQNFFLELAYPATLVPNRDVGVELQGKLADGRLAYALGLYDGTVDGGSTNANADGELELATRLHWRPLAARENGDDLGFGLAGTWGDRGGSPAPYRTVGQQPLFAWAEGVVADGTAWRLVPQAWYFHGPFGLMLEHARSTQELAGPEDRGEVRVDAWQAQAAWVLTGEAARFDGVRPQRPVGPAPGGRGAWQLNLRASELQVESGAAQRFGAIDTHGRATTWSLGVHWILNRWARWAIEVGSTEFADGPERPDERALTSRIQLRF